MLGIRKHETTDAYKQIIPPEISEGRFYELIGQICADSEIFSILEIGSSSGEGSTRALFEAISSLPGSRKEIHCLEISKERHQKLSEYLSPDARFHAHRISSVTTEEFPSFSKVKKFHSQEKSKLSSYHIDTIKSWYSKDIQFLIENPDLMPFGENGLRQSGIAWIKINFEIENFDFVIIDGGEFTGEAEFCYLQNSKYIALDDTNSYKCWGIREELKSNSNYELVEENQKERNGWAVFKLISEDVLN
jgi:hypothetical protein